MLRNTKLPNTLRLVVAAFAAALLGGAASAQEADN